MQSERASEGRNGEIDSDEQAEIKRQSNMKFSRNMMPVPQI